MDAGVSNLRSNSSKQPTQEPHVILWFLLMALNPSALASMREKRFQGSQPLHNKIASSIQDKCANLMNEGVLMPVDKQSNVEIGSSSGMPSKETMERNFCSYWALSTPDWLVASRQFVFAQEMINNTAHFSKHLWLKSIQA